MDNIEKDMAKKDKTKMKVRKFRNNLSEDAKNAIREIDRKKHSSKRTQLTEDERVELRAKDRERKARKKKEVKEAQKASEEDKKPYYVENEKEFNKMYKRKLRAERSEEEKMFEDIELLIRRRKERNERPEDIYLKDNLNAKAGMEEFRKFGRLMKHQERMFRSEGEMAIWRIYWNMGESYQTILKKMKPDIVKKLEELTLQAKGVARKDHKQKANKNDDSDGWGVKDGDWAWIGEGEPPDEGFYHEWNLDEDELAKLKEWEEQQVQWLRESLAEERIKKRKANNEYMKNYRRKKYNDLQKPIELPDVEPSDYEILRENNLKALEEAKKKSGLFDDEYD